MAKFFDWLAIRLNQLLVCPFAWSTFKLESNFGLPGNALPDSSRGLAFEPLSVVTRQENYNPNESC